MFTWLKSKQPTELSKTHTGTPSTSSAQVKSASEANTPNLKAALGTADAVLEAHNATQRKVAVQAWVASSPDDAELARVAKLLQDKDSGAAKLIKDVLAQHKAQATQSQAWAELQKRADALLAKDDLQAQDAVLLDEAMKAVASGEQAAVPEDLVETCERIALRLQHQATLQTELRQHVQGGTAALAELQQRFAQPIQQAQASRHVLHSTVGIAAQGLQASQEHKEWGAMPAKLQSQAMALQGELDAAWQRFEQQLAIAAVGVDDKAAPLPEVAAWAHELQVLRGAEVAVTNHAASEEMVKADEAAKAARRAAVAASLAEFKLTLTQLERALEQGHTKEAMGQANRLRNLHLTEQPPAVQARAHELLAKTSQLSDWQRWRSDQLREELCVKAEALAAEAAKHSTGSLKDAADEQEKTDIQSSVNSTLRADYAREEDSPGESIIDKGEPSTAVEAPVEAAPAVVEPIEAAPVAVEVATETVIETAAAVETAKPKKQHKPMSPRAIGDTLKSLRDEWKALDKTGEANGVLWARFDAACKLAFVPVEAYLAQEKARTQAVEKQRRDLLAEVNAWAAVHAPVVEAPVVHVESAVVEGVSQSEDAAVATSPLTPTLSREGRGGDQHHASHDESRFEHDWRAFTHALDKFSERWRNAGHLPEKRFVAMQALWKTAIDAAAAPLLQARVDSRQKREALIARTEELCAKPGPHLQERLRELQAQWTAESKRIALPRNVEQKLWERFRNPQDAAYNAKRAEHEQRVQARSSVETDVQQKIEALQTAADSGDEAAIREAGRALEAAWSAYAPAEETRHSPRDSRDARDARDSRGSRDSRDSRDGPRANPQLVQAQRKAHDAAHKKLQELAQGKRGNAIAALTKAWAARDAALLPELSDLRFKLNKAQWQGWQQAIAVPAKADEAARDAALLKLEVAFELDSPAEAQTARRALQLSLLASRGRDALVASWPDQVATVFASASTEQAAARLMACINAMK
jgi:ATP-dependent RNA helicase SUPV3L1/SUV3